jgi:hypothetical protein
MVENEQRHAFDFRRCAESHHSFALSVRSKSLECPALLGDLAFPVERLELAVVLIGPGLRASLGLFHNRPGVVMALPDGCGCDSWCGGAGWPALCAAGECGDFRGRSHRLSRRRARRLGVFVPACDGAVCTCRSETRRLVRGSPILAPAVDAGGRRSLWGPAAPRRRRRGRGDFGRRTRRRLVEVLRR